MVGREIGCAVVLVDEAVSRRHLQIEIQQGRCRVMDLGSANGTLLGDVALPPRRPIPVEPGQSLRVSGYQLVLRHARPGEHLETDRIILQADAAASLVPERDLLENKTLAAGLRIGAHIPFYLSFSNPAGEWKSFPLEAGRYVLGREPGCDIQIKSMLASRHHAELRVEGERAWLVDLHSANGVVVDGQNIPPGEPYELSAGSIFLIAQTPFLLTRQAHIDDSTKAQLSGMGTQVISSPRLDALMAVRESGDASVVTATRFLDLEGKDRISIGRAGDNTLVLDHPAVSRYHAVLERLGKRYRIVDTRSANGVYLNGKLIDGQAFVKEGDVLKIGPYDFVFSGAGMQVGAAEGYTLEARHLNKWVSKEINLLQDISLFIGANEFVAIVGMSGAGKTTLMDALNGYRPATHGTVLVDGVDLYAHYDMFRDDIGYVPQRDIVHMELTPWLALDYAGQLRFPPDTSVEERHQVVERTLKELGLWHRKDVVISKLSGGQLKRVSIGVELLTRPRLLFLDEPTSGLDPGTEREMMSLMRRLADQGRTVLVVTHTTKNVMLCDKVVILGTGGYLVFYGPPEEALEYFDAFRTPREKLERPMEFDEIYRLLEDAERGTPEEWAERYRQSEFYREQEPAISKSPEASRLPSMVTPSARQRKKISSFKQLKILSARNLRILLQDKISLALMLALAPLLGLMNSIWGSNIYDPRHGKIEKVMGLWFMSAVVAMLVGAMSSVREIVKEADIYKRERAVGLKVFPYIFSKFWLGFILALYQGGVILGIAMLLVRQPPAARQAFPELFVTIVLGVITGYLIGLLISAAVPNQNSALIALIAVVVPQLLFGGMFVPLDQIPFGEQISYAVFSRWTFEGFIVSTGIGDVIARDQCWKLPPEERSALTNEQKNSPECPCMGENLFTECTGIPELLSPEFYDTVAQQALAQPEPSRPVQPTELPTPTSMPTPTRLPTPTALPTPTPLPSPTPLPTPILLYELDKYRDASAAQQEAYFEQRSEQMSAYFDARSEQMSAYFDAVQEQYSAYSDSQKQAMEAYLEQRKTQAEDYSAALDVYSNDLADWQRNRQKAVGAAENVLKNLMGKFSRAFEGRVQDRWLVLVVQSVVMFGMILALQKRKDTL